MKMMTCIEDLRQAAGRKVPRAFSDFVEGGSYAEQTLAANCADLQRIKLRQRVLIDVSNRGTRSAILGEPVSLPLGLAPIGLCGMVHRDGEILACRAAQEAAIPFCLSTMSVCSIEDVATAVEKPFWFQMFFMKDRGFVRSLVERAAAAKCSALVATLDLPVIGQRHRDLRNGMGVPPELRIKNLIDMASRPAWALGIARGRRRTLGNLAGHVRGAENLDELSQWIGGQFNAPLSWKDVEWLAGLWPGKLVLKGILDVEDARIAAKTGAAALVVSNHGGASSTAHRPRSPSCLRSQTRSARRSMSCSTAVSVPDRTSCAPSHSARARVSPAAPTFTGSAPPDRRVSHEPSTSCAANSTSVWRSPALAELTTSTAG
jgi:L-lactate dehydrogenase (cytochrome)